MTCSPASTTSSAAGRRPMRRSLREAKNLALQALEDEAAQRGAAAIVAVDLDYEVIGGDRTTMPMVSANGTAVKLGQALLIRPCPRNLRPKIPVFHTDTYR